MRALSLLDVAFMAPEPEQTIKPHFNHWGLGVPFVEYGGAAEFVLTVAPHYDTWQVGVPFMNQGTGK